MRVTGHKKRKPATRSENGEKKKVREAQIIEVKTEVDRENLEAVSKMVEAKKIQEEITKISGEAGARKSKEAEPKNGEKVEREVKKEHIVKKISTGSGTSEPEAEPNKSVLVRKEEILFHPGHFGQGCRGRV